jgi:hypothetical protein
MVRLNDKALLSLVEDIEAHVDEMPVKCVDAWDIVVPRLRREIRTLHSDDIKRLSEALQARWTAKAIAEIPAPLPPAFNASRTESEDRLPVRYRAIFFTLVAIASLAAFYCLGRTITSNTQKVHDTREVRWQP